LPYTLPIPTRYGYIFKGWYEDGLLVDSIVQNTFENKTFNATWLKDSSAPLFVNLSTNVERIKSGEEITFTISFTDSSGVKNAEIQLENYDGKRLKVSFSNFDSTGKAETKMIFPSGYFYSASSLYYKYNRSFESKNHLYLRSVNVTDNLGNNRDYWEDPNRYSGVSSGANRLRTGFYIVVYS
jgi:uncharacterized repeat protein (TIGR02543 family)